MRRKVKEISISDLKYKIKHIGGLSAFELQIELLKILTPLAESASLGIQKEFLGKAVSSFLNGTLDIDEEKLLAMVGPDDAENLKDLLGEKLSPVELAQKLKDKLKEPDLVMSIIKESVQDSSLEQNIMKGIPDLISTISGVIQGIDQKVISNFMRDVISKSLVEIKIDTDKNWSIFGDGEKEINFEELEDLTAESWTDLLELTVFISLYNFAKPIAMLLKKSQMMEWVRDYLGPMMSNEKVA
jgi:hypothetical protein